MGTLSWLPCALKGTTVAKLVPYCSLNRSPVIKTMLDVGLAAVAKVRGLLHDDPMLGFGFSI
jgi:hypothetical protein